MGQQHTPLKKDILLEFPHVLIIDASAGSGKTETLAKRFVQFLLSSRIAHNDLTNMLAITFTNNAAREMRERILRWLKLCALDIDSREKQEIAQIVSMTPEELVRRAGYLVQTIIDRYTDFNIQTIDSFMTRILHASALELNLPMHSEITESYAPLIDITLSTMLRDLRRSISPKQIELFLDLMQHEAGSSFMWDPAWKLEQRFAEFLQAEGKELLDLTFEEVTDTYKKKLNMVREYYDTVVRAGFKAKIRKPVKDALDNPVFSLTTFLSGFSREALWFKKRGVAPEAHAQCEGLLSTVQNMVEAYTRSHYMHYAPLYCRFKELLEQIKRRSETLHFDDINKRLVQYIREETIPEIYYRLGDILYHFLLDEFQDTDIVQWKNMLLLLHEAFSKGGSLFAVGDLKQAIYMFRKADYRIMHRIVEGIRTQREYEDYYLPLSVMHSARVERLTENYRSAPVLLSYVANIFKTKLQQLTGTPLLHEDVTGLTTYVQKIASPDQDTTNTPPISRGYVRAFIVEKDGTQQEKNILNSIMDDVMARYQYRDIAILARKNSEVEQVVEWMNDRSIPAASFSSLDIRKRKVIMEIVALIRFLDAPVDSLSFITFLFGEIFERTVRASGILISMENLHKEVFTQCKRSSKNIYIWFREHSPYKDIWNILFNDLFSKVGYMPLYDLVSQIYRTFDIFTIFPEEAGFLVKFLEAICSLESRGLNNAKDFLKMVEENSGGSMLEIILPDYIDAVKVMTFHKAKGLGFPVVINLFYESQRRADPMYIGQDKDHLIPYYITQNIAKLSPMLEDIYNRTHQENAIQDLNMLYVANTRAQKEMYNIVIRKPRMGTTRDQDPSYLDLFEDYEEGEKEKPKKARSKLHPLVVNIPDKLHMVLPRGEEGYWFSERLLEVRKGDIFHDVLSKIIYLEDIHDLSQTVHAACVRARGVYDETAIVERLTRFLHDPRIDIWFKRAPARHILREIDLVFRDGAIYRPDRIVIDRDQVVVIDFKTGEPKAQYEVQVHTYMGIVKELYCDKKIRGFLAYIDTCIIQELQ